MLEGHRSPDPSLAYFPFLPWLPELLPEAPSVVLRCASKIASTAATAFAVLLLVLGSLYSNMIELVG